CDAYGTRFIATETGSLHPTNSWRDSELNHTQQAWDELLRIVDRLRQRAVKKGAVLLLEGFINNVLSKPEQAKRMIEALGTDGLALVMDPFNFIAKYQL